MPVSRVKVPSYYVCGVSKDGTPFVLGRFVSEEEAWNRGFADCRDTQFWEVKCYFTSQRSEATSAWKAELAHRLGNINEGFKRASHQMDEDIM